MTAEIAPLQLFHVGAAARHREELAWIEQLIGVPGFAYLLHDTQVSFTEDERHFFLLLDTDAVFTGDAAAHFGADLEYFVAGLAHALHFAGDLRVEEDQRVQIAIAGMENVAHAQAVAVADFANAPQHIWQFGTWHHAVLHVKFGTDAPDRTEGVLATRPEKLALGLVRCDAHGARMMLLANRYDGGRLFRDPLAQPLGLHKQHGGGVQRVARVGIGFHCLHNHLVHHFDGGGYHAGGDDLRDGVGGVIHRVEDGHHRFHVLGQMDDARDDFGDDAQCSLGADQQAGQVIAGRVGRPSTYLYDVALRRDDFHAQHVIGGDAVDEGMRPARVLAYVAANGAGTLAAGVWHVVVAAWIEGVAQV